MQFEEEKNQIIQSVLERIQANVKGQEGQLCMQFAKYYLGTVSHDDLNGMDVDDWYGSVVNYWNFIYQRIPRETKIRVYNPDFEQDGWQSTHTIIELVHDDMAFLVDSLHMEINRMGFVSYLIIHSGGLKVKRNGQHQITAILPANDEANHDFIPEAHIFIEINRQTDPKVLETIHKNFERVVNDVQSVVEDWDAMRQKVRQATAELKDIAPFVDPEELSESQDFLEWIENHHFTFLGVCDCQLDSTNGDKVLKEVPDTGLGILRESSKKSRRVGLMTPEAQKLLFSPQILITSKTNKISTVHRPAYTDYIGIKRFDKSGNVVGECRIIGLYTAAAYNASPRQIPFLRRKVELVMAKSGLNPRGHTAKILLNILETLPRDDLFQAPAEELLDIAMGVYHIQERRQIRLFARKDIYGRFISCLVYLPKDRFNTDMGRRIQNVIKQSFQAQDVSLSTRFTDSVLAQLHFIVRIDPDKLVEYDLKEIEQKIIEIGRSWNDEFKTDLLAAYGEEKGNEFFNLYENAFSGSYKEYFSSRTAVYDVKHIEHLSSNRQIEMNLYQPLGDTSGMIKFKLYRFDTTIALSDVLPILENLGLRVISERPFEIELKDGKKAWINDFGVLYPKTADWELSEIKDIFQEAFENTWFRKAENDGFNKLVLSAHLTWREVMILRAYAKYFKQIRLPFSQDYIETALISQPEIARQLINLFMTRFDPREILGREANFEAIHKEIIKALDQVESLDQDKILRHYISAILATVRTNYFQRRKDGNFKLYLSFKIEPSKIPDMPKPFPMYEIFVYSPRFEGVHLRCAKVARGGIRWSDRREDFRTEVLGLMKAQQVKNAVIVPDGAKGGFYPKNLPENGTRDEIAAEGVACYKRFIRALLDITDNYVGGSVVRPINVYCYDDEDPYLVVAADKGTATFSDIANSISLERNFWLADAFASGGSAGYDHKKMGITARGAWESVKRHFRELGVDTQTTNFTVVGIGDMAGDVFGNGMLLSRHIQLVGAFNHIHIFVDPNPDPELSFKERERLFHLPRSAWTDYDASLISKGGGVFNRKAKSIPVSPEMKERFEISQDNIEPNDLIRAMLKAPIDLLWNGGIGTFVKAEQERSADVGDRTNDAIRINGSELRCRVAGEGGNLGFTQLGRIEYALKGGLIYTDFIDNSAGVDCSDNEVNIKILLNHVVVNGDMTEKQRNQLLAKMTDEVADLVLRDNYQQTQAISFAAAQAYRQVDLHIRYMKDLEEKGLVDRAIEFLPEEKVLRERKLHGKGMTRPSMAILFAYTKKILSDQILASDVPEDPYFLKILSRAFPKPLQENYSQAMQQHHLRREIIATKLSNAVVNKMGFTFIYRGQDETGASVSNIVRAYTAACSIFDVDKLWAGIESLDSKVSVQAQIDMMMVCVRLMRRATRWLLRSNQMHLDIAAIIEFYRPGAEAFKNAIPECLTEAEREKYEQAFAQYVELGVSKALAKEFSLAPWLFALLDVVETASELNRPVADVAKTYFIVGNYLDLTWVREQVIIHPTENHWEALSREALRDDLDRQQRMLTHGILSQVSEKMELSACLNLWKERFAPLIARWQQILTELKNSQSLNFTMFFVSIRELLDLTLTAIRSSKVKKVKAK